MSEFNQGFERQFEPILPRVQPETVEKFLDEAKDLASHLERMEQRLSAEQPTLMPRMARYIASEARDSEEVINMMVVFGLTYGLLESQAKTDASNASSDGDSSKG